MKRASAIFLAALMMSAMAYAGQPVDAASLPAAITTFMNKHFPGDKVRKAEKDSGRRGVEYEVDLASGAEFDCFENGEWKEVKAAHGSAVPAAIVPEAIAAYVAKNFEGQKIVEISRKRGGYEVELTNGTELKLTADAKPFQPRQRRH